LSLPRWLPTGEQFTQWQDSELKQLVFNCVTTAEQYQKKTLTFFNPDQQIANETFVLILLNKATVMELERLNKKIDLLTKAINQLKKP